MTSERIAELRELCENATALSFSSFSDVSKSLSFIAVARTNIPKLLDELEAQEASYVRQLEDYADGVQSDLSYWKKRAAEMEAGYRFYGGCKACIHSGDSGGLKCDVGGNCGREKWEPRPGRFEEAEPLNCETCTEPTKRVLSWGDGGTERKPVYVYEYSCDNLQCPIAIAREQEKQDEQKRREAVHNENLANGVDMKHLRNLRINSDYLLLDCAQFLGVTTAIYSAYDCEKNPMPRDLYDRMVQFLKEARP